MTSNESSTYQVYLLRMWRSEPTQPWRVTLLPVGEEEEKDVLHFASMEQLAAFLRFKMRGRDLQREEDKSVTGNERRGD